MVSVAEYDAAKKFLTNTLIKHYENMYDADIDEFTAFELASGVLVAIYDESRLKAFEKNRLCQQHFGLSCQELKNQVDEGVETGDLLSPGRLIYLLRLSPRELEIYFAITTNQCIISLEDPKPQGCTRVFFERTRSGIPWQDYLKVLEQSGFDIYPFIILNIDLAAEALGVERKLLYDNMGNASWLHCKSDLYRELLAHPKSVVAAKASIEKVCTDTIRRACTIEMPRRFLPNLKKVQWPNC